MSNPVNGITSSFDCYHCGDANALDEKFWTWFLNPDALQRARALEGDDEAKSGRIMPVCCSASNYLPDGLWRQLRPVPRPIDFYLISRS